MANAETLARFQNAIMNARQLPPDLLTNSQKLKLYALYKQTEQPAPEDPPPRVNPLARAKVAATHTRRSWFTDCPSALTVPVRCHRAVGGVERRAYPERAAGTWRATLTLSLTLSL